MKRRLTLMAGLLFFSIMTYAQDFKLVDYTGGYDQPHAADFSLKINPLKKRIPVMNFDFNKDGKTDTILYKLSNKATANFATIQVFDAKEDDWVMLYKLDLKNWGGEDGIWFYQLNDKAGGPPKLMVYTGQKSNKMLTLIHFDSATGKWVTKDYKLNEKNLFPHMYVVNKKKIRNHSGANSGERDAYDEIPAE